MSQQVHCLSRQASGNYINIESLNFTPPNIPLLIVIKKTKQTLNTLILYDHKILLQEVFGSSMWAAAPMMSVCQLLTTPVHICKWFYV